MTGVVIPAEARQSIALTDGRPSAARGDAVTRALMDALRHAGYAAAGS
jgi:hypothetical protein